MIKKLRRKFIIIIMSILFVVFTIILGTLNFINYKSGELQNKELMNVLAGSDGIPLRLNDNSYQARPFPPGMPQFNSSISIMLDHDNQLIDMISMNVSEFSNENMDSIIQTVTNRGSEFGKVSTFYFLIKDKPYGKIIVLLENSAAVSFNQRLLLLSIIIGASSLLILFFVSLFLSRLIVKPVEESFNKQKQFISDASHELKTPLSVISVNADVLENEVGSSKWLNYIKSETSRMSGLVNQLLSIARMDDTKRPLNFTQFNLSEAIYQILLPFESTAFEQQKTYTYDIEDALYYSGEEESIKQMAAILIDNAIKHTNPSGAIHLILKHHASKLHFEVFNTGKGIDPLEKDKIFERFYCSDFSRARENGGYGLGLSIAKSIVQAHHGKISVQSEPGAWARFIVQL